ncbi:MAG: hypothetical protein GX257_11170 [Clostridiales bacterium]|jgi:hypothetical protein|nr:hypothetical protein [Clostridiales bacterium]
MINEILEISPDNERINDMMETYAESGLFSTAQQQLTGRSSRPGANAQLFLFGNEAGGRVLLWFQQKMLSQNLRKRKLMLQ